jgi:hypothetical protein
MHFSFLDAVLNYIHGDGLVILPQMELLLFALGILIFDFLLEQKEKRWNAILALFGIAAGAAGLFMQYKKYSAQRSSPFGTPGLLGFHSTVLIDGFLPPLPSSYCSLFVTSTLKKSRKANITP